MFSLLIKYPSGVRVWDTLPTLEALQQDMEARYKDAMEYERIGIEFTITYNGV